MRASDADSQKVGVDFSNDAVVVIRKQDLVAGIKQFAFNSLDDPCIVMLVDQRMSRLLPEQEADNASSLRAHGASYCVRSISNLCGIFMHPLARGSAVARIVLAQDVGNRSAVQTEVCGYLTKGNHTSLNLIGKQCA